MKGDQAKKGVLFGCLRERWKGDREGVRAMINEGVREGDIDKK